MIFTFYNFFFHFYRSFYIDSLENNFKNFLMNITDVDLMLKRVENNQKRKRNIPIYIFFCPIREKSIYFKVNRHIYNLKNKPFVDLFILKYIYIYIYIYIYNRRTNKSFKILLQMKKSSQILAIRVG